MREQQKLQRYQVVHREPTRVVLFDPLTHRYASARIVEGAEPLHFYTIDNKMRVCAYPLTYRNARALMCWLDYEAASRLGVFEYDEDQAA